MLDIRQVDYCTYDWNNIFCMGYFCRKRNKVYSVKLPVPKKDRDLLPTTITILHPGWAKLINKAFKELKEKYDADQ